MEKFLVTNIRHPDTNKDRVFISVKNLSTGERTHYSVKPEKYNQLVEKGLAYNKPLDANLFNGLQKIAGVRSGQKV